jgi:hypothetical protein
MKFGKFQDIGLFINKNSCGSDQGSLLKIHQLIVLGTVRYGEEAYGSATEAVLKKLEPTHNRGNRLALRAFAVSRTENVLCEAGMTTLTEVTKQHKGNDTISHKQGAPKKTLLHQPVQN